MSFLLATFTLVCVLAPGIPVAQWLSQLAGVAHALAFARILGVVMVLVAVGVMHRHRPAVLWAMSAVVLILFPHGSAPVTSDDRALTVMAYNTQDSLTPERLRGLITSYDPDVVVLPEMTVPTIPTPNYHLLAGPDGDGAYPPTIMMVHHRLGPITTVEGPDVAWGSVAVELADGTVLAGVHSMPPLPTTMKEWRADLATVDEWVEGHHRLILAGDFNATERHGPLAATGLLSGDCGGTWPAALPPWLATSIDHVLVSPEIGIGECRVVRIGASDHRAVVAQIGMG